MATPDSDPYSSVVLRKERLRRAIRDVSWAGWVRGGFVGIITGLMMGEVSIIPVIAGFAAAGLVLLAQVVGNYVERAEPQVLRERLDAARGHLRSLEQTITKRVATMVQVAAYGQNIAALGESVRSADDVKVWEKGLSFFMQSLSGQVQPSLAEHEWLRLRDAEDDGRALPTGQFDEHHRHEMRKLRARLEALQSLIREHTHRQ